MEKKFSGKIWKFGNDIDTDTIIPGKRGTIPDRNEMKKYAFELLKPEFGSTVQPGDILVAGTNFGCGSSREQAATVLSYNGVRCIIAKSFARIFFRNAFNNGILLLTCDQIQDVCEGGDIVTVDVDAQTVSVNGKTFKVGAVPENLYNIVANGGLIEDTRKRLAAGNIKTDIKPLSIEQCRKKGYTMVEKLLKKNAGKEHVVPGDIVITKPDMFMIHDIYTTYLLETMNQIGADKIDDPDKVTIVWDHCMPTAVAKMTTIIMKQVWNWLRSMVLRNFILVKASATPLCMKQSMQSQVRSQLQQTVIQPLTAAPETSAPVLVQQKWQQPLLPENFGLRFRKLLRSY